MKNWYTMEPDVYRLMNKHYTKGRNGAKVSMVVIHHNAGILSVNDIWNVWQSRQASAHYQVTSAGEIGQLVNDWDTAWHAANAYINERSIAIEVSNSGRSAQNWPITPKAVEEAAHLTAAIHRSEKLGRPVSGRTIRYHKEFTSTSCPYHLAPGGLYHATFLNRVFWWYDQMAIGKVPTPAPTAPKENKVDKQQADRIESLLRLVLEQISGKEINGNQEFNGWDQGGLRTLYDVAAASAAKLEVPGTRDVKEK